MTKLKNFLIKNSPEILIGVGICGFIGTTVLAVKATPKAMKILDEKKKYLEKDELTKKEIIKYTWKEYLPATLVCVGSISCVIGGCGINKKRNLALGAAYKIAETTLTTYRDKVIETIGEKKEKEIRDSISQDKVNDDSKENKTIILTNKGDCLCKDSISGRYFRSNIETIKKTVNDLNIEIINNLGYVSLNMFYDCLGLEPIKDGDAMFWTTATGIIELDYDACLTQEGEPCIVIDFINRPIPEYTCFK